MESQALRACLHIIYALGAQFELNEVIKKTLQECRIANAAFTSRWHYCREFITHAPLEASPETYLYI